MKHLTTPKRKKITCLLTKGKLTSLASELMKHSKYARPLIHKIAAVVRKELKVLCSDSGSHIFSSNRLSNFSWADYVGKIEKYDPSLVETLSIILTGKYKENVDVVRIIGVIISILTSFKRKSLNTF